MTAPRYGSHFDSPVHKGAYSRRWRTRAVDFARAQVCRVDFVAILRDNLDDMNAVLQASYRDGDDADTGGMLLAAWIKGKFGDA